MQAIDPNLTLDQQGTPVADLHFALDKLGFGEPILAEEREAQRYGPGTAEAVRQLQGQLGIDAAQPGQMDGPTAEALNRRLFESSVFNMVRGRVTNVDGSSVAGHLLMAFDRENLGGAYLGAAYSNADGAYLIFYDPTLYSMPGEGVLRIKEILDLVVQVYDAAGTTLTESATLHDPQREERVDLQLGAAPPERSFVVRGQVVDEGGPRNGILVTIHDRDLFFGRDGAAAGQWLGSATTRNLPLKGEDGWFEVSYGSADYIAREGDKDGPVADLIFLLSADGRPLDGFRLYRLPDGAVLTEQTEVGGADLVLGVRARSVEEVRISLPGGSTARYPSEYERLLRTTARLLPEQPAADAPLDELEVAVGGAVRRFDEERYRDVSFVVRETGVDRSAVDALVAAFAMALNPFDNQVPVAVLYGLARTRSAGSMAALARLSAAETLAGLQWATAGEVPIIPPFATEEQLDATVELLRRLIEQLLPAYRPAADAPALADLLGAALPDPADQATLWRAYADQAATPTEFWRELRRQPGFADEAKIAAAQFAFQLGALAQNNTSLVAAVQQQHPDLRSGVGLALRLDTQEKWLALLDDGAVQIPDDVPGADDEQRKENYAASLHAALSAVQPTTAVAGLVAMLPPELLGSAQEGVSRVLRGAVEAGFDLATGRVDDLLARNGEAVLEGVEPEQRTTVVEQVKRVQRLFRLSSDSRSLRALLDSGIASAHDLAGMAPAVAMDMLRPALGEEAARLTITRAARISASAANRYVLLHDMSNGVVPGAIMSAGDQQTAQEVAAAHTQSYTAMFGSVELCDCQDCRSIHSPAAYFVDLLQFLDPKIAAVTPLDVLLGNPSKNVVGRRPDLAHIELSCENTNTPLPYLDLVNEVLESYIVFTQTLPLKTDAAHVPLVPPVPQPNASTPGASGAELAAAPENILEQAYDALEPAVYPFTLPYNQPLAALRLLLEQMGSSRGELIELFARPGQTTSRALHAEALRLSDREFAMLSGEHFDGTAEAVAVPGRYGFDAPAAPADYAWVAGSVPTGAQQHADNDAWSFAPAAAPPPSGAVAHTSTVRAGLHQHYFDGVSAANALRVGQHDMLYAEVLLDAASMPQQLMVQWNDGSWSHRAYWGSSKMMLGVESTASRRFMGPLPEPGVWTRLEIPAYFVGLAGRELVGMAFTLFDGGATWGAAGGRTPSWVEQLTHVPAFLARSGVSYVELVSLVETGYCNPALPVGAAREEFKRIPLSYATLAELVAGNFAAPGAQTLAALDAAGITIEELAAWSAEHFAPLGKLIVLDAPDSACDLTLTRLLHLDGTLLEEAELDRFQRFIRLWRKLGWSVADLDRAIAALGDGTITPAFLRRLGRLVELAEELKLSPQQLLAFYGFIPTAGDEALYRRLFLNKAVRELDEAFLALEGEYLPVAANLKIDDHLPALLAGLRTRASDLALIRGHLGLAAADAPLTLATATLLYRYAALARALRLAVADLITLEKLSGLVPFSELDPAGTAFDHIEPARTAHFIDLARRVAAARFLPATLDYLFNKLGTPPSRLAPAPASTRQLLATIREGLVAIAVENTPADDPTGETTRARLGLLFEGHIVAQLGGLIAGSAVYTAPLAAPPPSLPEGGKVSYDPAGRMLQAAGWLTAGERDALLALSPDSGYQQAVGVLYQQPRDLLAQTLVARLAWPTAEADLAAVVLETSALGADGQRDQALVAQKFKRFLALALPYIRTTLSRALVNQVLADALETEPATAALLLEGRDGVAWLPSAANSSLPAGADFLGLVGDGLTADYFANETLAGPAQTMLEPVLDLRWEGRHGFSARWQGQVLADKTQRYAFHLRAGGGVRLFLDGTKLLDRWQDAEPAEYTAAVDLQAGTMHTLQIEYFNHAVAALIELRWSSPSTAAEIVPAYRLYSAGRGDVLAAAETTFVRLHKAVLLVDGFKLASDELALLADPAQPAALHLNDLPVAADPPDRQALFSAWLRWADYCELRAKALAEPARLREVLGATGVDEAQAALVLATGWEAAALAELAGPTGFNLPPAAYRDPTALLGLARAMGLLLKLRAPARELFEWADPAPTLARTRLAVQQVRRSYKAQYDEESWLEVARRVNDRLREEQRDALVAYLLPRLGLSSPDQLFEFFLIDVQMNACMATSRIKQAISSVQLFVERCRMNLEPRVSPALIDSERWRWMQNYRVWEANMKVFLYPENWIEPELRDDKSAFFSELEAELLQDEVTNTTAELALANYLEKLDAVSNLRVCGMLLQTDFAADEGQESVLHVFGHTFSTPHVFYYRQLVQVNSSYRYWTPWERVPLDIQADEVLPVIWNRRLYLFWPVITQKSGGNSTTTTQIRLAWSEYRDKKWSAKSVTAADQALVPSKSGPFRMDVEYRGDELTVVFATLSQGICYSGPQFDKDGAISGAAGQTAAISNRLGSLTFRNYNGLVQPNAGAAKAVTYDRGFLPMGGKTLSFSPVQCADQPVEMFGRVPDTGGVRVYAPGSAPLTLDDPFFLQEGPRAYLVWPHSYTRSRFSGLLEEAVPFLPATKEKAKAFDPKEDLGRPLQTRLDMLRSEANPWLAGQADIMTMEMRTMSAPAPAGQATMSLELSPASRLFEYGVVGAVEVIGVGAFGRAHNAADFTFETFFHPYGPEYQRRLNRYGVPGLLSLESQIAAEMPKVASFGDAYDPKPAVNKPWPVHDVDFSFSGAYSVYNWEIFFHVPLFLAVRLSQNQRFEEALKWFHYIFDPTSGADDGPLPQRYWNVLPLRQAAPQSLGDLLKALHAGDPNAVAQWEDLQAHPFQPHRVARMRLVAYQKTVLMKYIDNLIAWGDQLFSRDTIETINQATQLYVLAATLLGPRAERVPPRGRNTNRTYAQLRSGLDAINEALVQFENDVPYSSLSGSGMAGAETAGLLGIGRTFYFCLTQNSKLLGYWDTVADRLFKIRNCMNIEGVVRQLPLFEPPIDPALLVRAAASGLDLGSVLADLNAPLPYYRFSAMLAQATALTGELRSLANALLAALEKRDAEQLARLRAAHETELLGLVKEMKRRQLDEAQASHEGLQKSRALVEARYNFYANIPQRISEEINQLGQLAAAQENQRASQSADNTAADILTYSPDFSVGVIAGPMGGATASVTLGRGNLVAYFQAVSRRESMRAGEKTYNANLSSILGGWHRRADDWKLQADLARKEIEQIDKQIAAAEIRVAIAERDLDNTSRQIEQAAEIEEFLRSKFSNEELYNWMRGELAALYFQCYQLTYELAKKAERCYRFERGVSSSNFIQFGAWDSMRKGLLAGERLFWQLKQLERAYLEGNRRDYEITRHYSLLLNAPGALISLRARGWCEVELPEALFDLDFPGHFMRRIKSVSLSIPAVVGPYTGVNCTLTLLSDKTRVKSTVAGDYAQREGEEDDRFVTNWARSQAIATSGGQNDSGLFQLDFRDERYLPFEGAGAISRWRIELAREFRQFDYDSIADVVLHINYTAREGGVPLREAAVKALTAALEDEEGRPQARLFSLRHEFPSEWSRLVNSADASGDHSQAFSLAKSRFPLVFRGATLTIYSVEVFGVPREADGGAPPTLDLTLAGPDSSQPPLDLKAALAVGDVVHKKAEAAVEVKDPGETRKEADWTISVAAAAVPPSLARLKDILLLCHYTVRLP